MGAVFFSPADPCVPRVIVPLQECPEGEIQPVDTHDHQTLAHTVTDYTTNKVKYQKTIFIVRIVDWKRDCPFANGYARNLPVFVIIVIVVLLLFVSYHF